MSRREGWLVIFDNICILSSQIVSLFWSSAESWNKLLLETYMYGKLVCFETQPGTHSPPVLDQYQGFVKHIDHATPHSKDRVPAVSWIMVALNKILEHLDSTYLLVGWFKVFKNRGILKNIWKYWDLSLNHRSSVLTCNYQSGCS